MRFRCFALGLTGLLLSGCAGLIDRATQDFSRDLEAAVLDYPEPLVVERGLPAFLLILEARHRRDPDNAALALSLASLSSTYAGLFVDEPEAARRLHQRALDLAAQGLCAASSPLCGLVDATYADFEQRVSALNASDAEQAYVLASIWTGWIAAHRGEMAALADLPKVERLLERVAEWSPEHDHGRVWLYRAVLNSQRPPAAGGRPDLAREQFARAREISGGTDLLVDVFLAEYYARLTFDRELWVQTLESVLAADGDHPGRVLSNRIARQRAAHLLAQTSSIFD